MRGRGVRLINLRLITCCVCNSHLHSHVAPGLIVIFGRAVRSSSWPVHGSAHERDIAESTDFWRTGVAFVARKADTSSPANTTARPYCTLPRPHRALTARHPGPASPPHADIWTPASPLPCMRAAFAAEAPEQLAPRHNPTKATIRFVPLLHSDTIHRAHPELSTPAAPIRRSCTSTGNYRSPRPWRRPPHAVLAGLTAA